MSRHLESYGGEVFVPAGIDPDIPAPARMYDWFLDGRYNYAADREACARVEKIFPDVKIGSWENRRFLQRVVRFLLGAGIRQFIDIGAGLPTEGNIHETAQQEARNTRVVYVDNDPIVVAHAGELLTTVDPV